MKWLVFSDSHGSIDFMKRAIERERPDRVLHLGDVIRDVPKLQAVCPGVAIEQVRGNCDLWDGEDIPEERELFLGDKRVWMLHGHTYQVKLGVGMLLSEARARGVDAVLFGHTHDPLCCREGDLWVMNPGTVSGVPRATCGVLELQDGALTCRTVVIGKAAGGPKRRWSI